MSKKTANLNVRLSLEMQEQISIVSPFSNKSEYVRRLIRKDCQEALKQLQGENRQV